MMSIFEAAEAFRSGSVSSTELTENCLLRADLYDDRLGVFLTRFDDAALSAADQADKARSRGMDTGPLMGIPIGVKDAFATAEAAITAQSLVPVPGWNGKRGDAQAVARLRAAGAVIVGKTTMTEYCISRPDENQPFPLPRNPWNPDRWAGGSSSGSAAGVLTGMFLGGLGTDSGGSGRIPAAYCGVTALMPTFGRVPTAGVLPYGHSMDVVAPIARSARDCALLFEALAGERGADLEGDLDGLRIGVDRLDRVIGGSGDPVLPDLLDAALDTMATLGATVVDIELPRFRDAIMAALIVLPAEALAVHSPNVHTHWGDYTPGTREILRSAAMFSATDYVQAQKVRQLVKRDLAAVYRDVDLIITPTMPVVAPRFADLASFVGGEHANILLTPYWNAVGHPALTVPVGFNAANLPLGMQIAGRPSDETTVLRAGHLYQQNTDWHLRTPEAVA